MPTPTPDIPPEEKPQLDAIARAHSRDEADHTGLYPCKRWMYFYWKIRKDYGQTPQDRPQPTYTSVTGA